MNPSVLTELRQVFQSVLLADQEMDESDQMVGDALPGQGGGDIVIIKIGIGGSLLCWISLSVLVLLRIFKSDAAVVNESTN